MIAVLLCAGFATRMYPLTEDFPKPLLPVAGRPVIDYLMDQISGLPGLRTVHVVTNAKFLHHFENWQSTWAHANPDKPITIRLHNDGATSNENRLGASIDLQLVFHRIYAPSKVLVSAGDNIFMFSLVSLWEQFLKNDHHYTVALPQKDPMKLKKTGVLELGKDNRVLNFYEKPEQPPSTWCCPALYFFQPSAWAVLDAFVESTGNTDAPGFFIQYLCQKEEVYAFKPDGYHIDIGTIDSYRQADQLLQN